MRLSFALVLILAAAAAATAPAVAADVNLNVYPVAGRSMHDSDFWDPIEDQYALGGTVDFAKAGSPLHFALGLHGSVGDEDIETANINELSFGITKVWTPEGSVRPFVGGGLSFVHAELEFDTVGTGTVNDDDDSAGLWIEGGVYWRLSAHFNLGLFGRSLLGTNITLFGEDTDADYFEVGPMIGWSWPAKK